MSARAGTRQQSSSAKLLATHKLVARDSLSRLVRNLGATLISSLVIAIALLLPALLFLFQLNINTVLDELDKGADISVYLQPNLSESEINKLSEDLLTWDYTESLRLISSTQALEDFSDAAGLADLLAALEENPLPASFILTPASAQISDLEALESALLELPEVLTVDVDRAWLERLAAISGLLALVGRILLVFVLIGLFTIIGNTIRLAIESRREEIQVQKLIGATDAYIARPFLYTGTLLGTAGGFMASLGLLLLWAVISNSFGQLASLYNNGIVLAQLPLWSFFILILLGMGIGWIAAFVSSYRNLATIEP